MWMFFVLFCLIVIPDHLPQLRKSLILFMSLPVHLARKIAERDVELHVLISDVAGAPVDDGITVHPIMQQYNVYVVASPKDRHIKAVQLNQIVKAFGLKPPLDNISTLSLTNSSKDDDVFQTSLYFA